MCTHFFHVIHQGFKEFNDVTPLYWNRPYIILDEELLGGNIYDMPYDDSPQYSNINDGRPDSDAGEITDDLTNVQ